VVLIEVASPYLPPKVPLLEEIKPKKMFGQERIEFWALGNLGNCFVLGNLNSILVACKIEIMLASWQCSNSNLRFGKVET
jgi:hypothetical protein